MMIDKYLGLRISVLYRYLHACLQTTHPCMPMYIRIHHTVGYGYHVLYWRASGGSLDDILGLAVLKFRPLCETFLLRFYTGINVGLYFADSFPSTFIVYIIVLT